MTPKIGIRPAIDGRYGGVRESLEEPTLAMARAAARLISDRVRTADGRAVECVIPEFCIGGLAENQACADLFDREGVGVSLTVTPCWCYGSETIDRHPTRPKAIWGFNGTERPGAVYLAAALAGHSQFGLPCFGIYGHDVQDQGDEAIPEDVAEKILRFARAGLAVAQMRGRSYLSVGGTSMGIAGSVVDPAFFQRFLGMSVMAVDMSEVRGRMESGVFDHDEFERALAWVKSRCREGFDPNPESDRPDRATLDRRWADSVKMTLILRDLMIANPRLAEMGFHEQARAHNAIAGGFQGQRQWTDHYPNGDFSEAVLSSSFDWNGIREPLAFATENDACNAVTMLFGKLLTGAASLFADVRTYWSPEAVQRVSGWTPDGPAAGGFLHLINSGPAALDWTGAAEGGVKPWHEMTPEDAEACLAATTWHNSVQEYFPGGGWSTRFRTRGGLPMTLARLNLVAGLGPVLQVAEGWSIDLPDDVHDALDHRTNPTWPTTWFVPRITGRGVFTYAYEVMNAWGANHGAAAPGHVGADFLSLAAMLRIPVDMHNMAREDVFRPSVWNRLGTEDLESADYRACSMLG
ncbi:MAG: L-fucose isomerase, partial [Fimbriimonadaceae bacterium]|nr:L-fucose isomerase [Fimbriimonadaceae bacterium]